MHEMALVRRVVDIVLEECAGKDVTSVKSVHLVVGELRDVVENLVPGLFRWLTRDTIAAEAEVVMRRVPAMVRCNRCGEIFRIDVRDKATWECPRCHAYQDYRLFSGNEFRIECIEVEAGGSGEPDEPPTDACAEEIGAPAA